METFKVDILNPKAKKLLKDLADLDLIAIHQSNDGDLKRILRNLRDKSASVPTPEEIAHEVEIVRESRYNK